MEDPDKARAEITANWQSFFNPRTPVSKKTALLEDGSLYELFVQAIHDDPQVGASTGVVDKVTITSPTSADVSFRLVVQHKPLLHGIGQASRQGETWKVSVKTLCAIATSGRDIARPGVCEPNSLQ